MPGLAQRCDRCFHHAGDLACYHATGEYLCEPCLISRAEQYLHDNGWIFDRRIPIHEDSPPIAQGPIA